MGPTAKTHLPAGCTAKGQEEAAQAWWGRGAKSCKSLGFTRATKAHLVLQDASTTHLFVSFAMPISQVREAGSPRGWTTGTPGEGLAPAGVNLHILGAH